MPRRPAWINTGGVWAGNGRGVQRSIDIDGYHVAVVGSAEWASDIGD